MPVLDGKGALVSDIDEKGEHETVRDMQKLGGEVRLTADSSVD